MCKLGFWQLDRAKQKEQELLAFSQLKQLPQSQLFSLPESQITELHGRTASLTGNIDKNQAWLVDNKIFQGQVGYSLVAKLNMLNDSRSVLVDLGWIAASKYRDELPTVQLPNEIEVSARIKSNHFDQFVLENKIGEQPANENGTTKVQRVQSYQQILVQNKETVLPLIAFAPSNTIDEMPQLYNPVVMPPEKHVAYAVQWFLLALASIIVYLFASRTNSHKNKHKQELNDES